MHYIDPVHYSMYISNILYEYIIYAVKLPVAQNFWSHSICENIIVWLYTFATSSFLFLVAMASNLLAMAST